MAEKTEYDVIIVGGGHNGLTCGALLARAGLDVLVLERRHNIGGGCCTEEVTLPGFRHNLHSQGHVWMVRGPVYRALQLDKLGVQYVYPDPVYAMVFRDGRSLCLYKDLDRTCEQIAQFSKRDADAYREHYQRFEALRRLVISSWYAPPLPPSKLFASLEGTEDGMRVLQMMNMSTERVCHELFEDEAVKAWILLLAMQGGNPLDLSGTGVWLTVLVSGFHERPWGICVGGSRQLAEGLQKALEAAGGTVRKQAHVSRILVQQGEARGVELADGTRYAARQAIASNTNPIATFTELITPEHSDAAFLRKVKNYQADDMSLFTPHLALNEAPRYTASAGNPDVQKAMFVGWGQETVDEMHQQFNAIRLRQLPESVGGMSIAPTVHDPTQAPPGKHTAFFWQFAPFEIGDSAAAWDREKEAYADHCLEVWRQYAPNMNAENILGRYIYSPLDISRNTISMFRGSQMHGSVGPHQMGAFRPFPGWSGYRMPIKRLYLCGGSTHPCGGVTGAPGFNAAGVIADDVGVKKWWLRA
ncbi:MAG: NAD(P)/FAD-dependent oxidoreductase [Candidatus Tectomicrobia bacterium]|nr:NAD(P)/FAD-dependent oxidoreductase [Candidatus Tectomicrobia bacterium]